MRKPASWLAVLVGTGVAIRADAFVPLQDFVHSARGIALPSSVALSVSTFPDGDQQPDNSRVVHVEELSEFTKSFNQQLVQTLKAIMESLYQGNTLQQHVARFHTLEVVARVPYFSYVSVLHLFETLGRIRQAKLLQLHFAQSYNELHHLLIMEALQSPSFRDSFISQHIAVFYYWTVAILFLVNPAAAYHLNELIEEEAFGTYDAFLREYGDELQQYEAPMVAQEYYAHEQGIEVRNLYDTFVAIRNDEAAHAQSMKTLRLT